MSYYNSQRTPNKVLQPTRRHNIDGSSSNLKLKETFDLDLDRLARELNVSPTRNRPSTRHVFTSTAFGTPSATVSSFISASPKASSSLSPPSSSSSSSSTTTTAAKTKTKTKTTLDGIASRRERYQAAAATTTSGDETPSWAKQDFRKILNKSPSKVVDSYNSRAHAPRTPGTTPSSSPTKYSAGVPGDHTSPGYEYLCRIEAIKLWLQEVLDDQIEQTAVELIPYIRNGIHLAKLANAILPTQRKVFTDDTRLQFKHTENINRFFHLLDFLNMPDLFRFELTDLYDAKNIPKVWFCLHALSYILHRSDSRYPKMKDLVNVLTFTQDDIKAANKALVGAPLPKFSGADIGIDGDTKFMDAVSSPIKLSSKARTRSVVDQSPFIDTPKSPSKQLHSPSKTTRPVDIPPKTRINTSLLQEQESIKRNRDFTGSGTELEQVSPYLVKLQALCRGANFRYSMFANRILLKSFCDELTTFQSVLRGAKVRRLTIHKHRDKLQGHNHMLVQLQSIIRRKLLMSKKPKVSSKETFDETEQLQSICRGFMVRNKLEETKQKLELETSLYQTVKLQSIVRMKKVSKLTSIVLLQSKDFHTNMIEFQSIIRAKLYTKYSTVAFDDISGIVELQAMAKRNLVIDEINYKHSVIRSCKRKIIDFQSICRGAISRTRICNGVLITLMHEDDAINELFAIARGKQLRAKFNAVKAELQMLEHKSVLPVQTLFRGILSRYQKEVVLDDVYLHIDQIITLQSYVRSLRTRRTFDAVNEYYHQRVPEIVHAQAIIRKVLAQRAYRAFISNTQPTLPVVRKFAFLLIETEADIEEERKLSRSRERVVELSKINENLESEIENFDFKLTLLDKNKITVDEFAKLNHLRHSMRLPEEMNLKGLSKTIRARIECYQRLVYLLQTRPEYWGRLFQSFDHHQFKNSQQYRDLFTCLLQIFACEQTSTSTHSREERYFIKFILTLMQNDIAQSQTLSDITKVHFTYWIEYLAHFNSRTSQRQHLKALFGAFVIQTTEDDEFDFESDPTSILSTIIAKEIRVTGTSTKKPTSDPQEAIRCPEVSTQFVRNLTSLREHCHEFFGKVQKCVDKIPHHIRVLCREAYLISKSRYPEKSSKQHMAVAGVVFFKHYIGSIFNTPENYGIRLKQDSKEKINLHQMYRVLLQLFSMHPFSDNFLKPLNDYILSMSDPAELLIQEIIDIQSDAYDIGEYEDLMSTTKPYVKIKANSMIFLERIVTNNLETMAPDFNDQLVTVMSNLNSIVSSSNDFVILNDLNVLTFALNSSALDESITDTKTKFLFAQAKRCLLYIMRVQEQGDDLLELLISGIKPADEQKFQEILNAENEDNNVKAGHRSKAVIGNTEVVTYHELKRKCLEDILKLETMGHLTRKNSFQELLNQISDDIRKKGTERWTRFEQIKMLEMTCKKITDKEKFLRKQLQEYKRHVDQILVDSQVIPKDKKLFNIIPLFSKQYFYHRELRRRNKTPKFGSRIVSAKRLMEQNVLLSYGYDAPRNKLELIFSCHEVGKFTIEVAKGSVVVTGASAIVTLDELLALQYENKPKLSLCSNNIVFDSGNITAFIFKTFYDVQSQN